MSKNAVHVCLNQIKTDKNYEISLLQKENSNLQESLISSENKVSNLESELIEIYTSKSWKITKPLRNIVRNLKKR